MVPAGTAGIAAGTPCGTSFSQTKKRMQGRWTRAGRSPIRRSRKAAFARRVQAQVAQLVEQRIENPRVGGSIPPLGTTSFKFFSNLATSVKF